MIYPDSSLNLIPAGDLLTIREHDRSRGLTLLRAVMGMMWMAPAGLVLYVLAGGPGAKFPLVAPSNWQGWIVGGLVLCLFLAMLVVLPLVIGFSIAFTRQRFVLDRKSGDFREETFLGGIRILIRRHPWQDFSVLRVREHTGRTLRFTIHCNGPKRDVAVAAFTHGWQANQMAEELGAFLGLPARTLPGQTRPSRIVIQRC
ncbi:MAG TPA: hypothetical protein VG796_27215 [Verrucomicrobiales bacterium]|nr:hypothetical protein [Verrucomicrobiales bacterium]